MASPKKVALAPEHLRFAVLATDIALFTVKNEQLHVRLIRVNRPPHFPNVPGLPGGLLLPHETAEDAVNRFLKDRGHIAPEEVHIEQLFTFSRVDRDPRGRVVAVAYLGLVPWEKLSAQEQADSAESWWCPISQTKGLAYDHDEILATALARLRSRVTYTTLIRKLMPGEFTLTELEKTYESILKTDLDKRNFRKKILKLGILTALSEKRRGGSFRPAQLYSFSARKVVDIGVL